LKKELSNIKLISILLALVSVQSCVNFNPEEIQNLNQGKVLRIGHGGLGFVSLFPFNPYPANSFKSLKLALEKYNADGIEVDVQLSADEQIILYHDNFLNSKTSLTECISNYDFKKIVNTPYSLGIPYDWFQNEKVIGLDSLLSYLNASEKKPLLHLDVRHYSLCLGAENNDRRMYILVDRLIELLNRYRFPLKNVLINSGSLDLCNYVQSKELSISVSFELNNSLELSLPDVQLAGIKFMTVKPEILTKEISQKIHAVGIQVITFGGNRKKWNVELLEKNPDMIQTNNLKSLNELILIE
jgi:glycerophosphoryl diester phosphodiesterase